MFFVDYKVVDCVTSLFLWLSEFSWEHPFAVVHDWVTWCDLKTIVECAYFWHSINGVELDNTPECCPAWWSLNLFTFLKKMNLFFRSISHLNERITSEASTSSTSWIIIITSSGITGIVCLIVKNRCKLCLVLDISYSSFLACSSSFSLLSFEWFFWWWHIVKNVISSIGNIIESITSKVGKARISKIAFILQVQCSDRLAVLVHSPLLHILILLKGDKCLSFKSLDHSFVEIVIKIQFLPLIIEFLSWIQTLFNTSCTVIFERFCNVFEKINAFIPELVGHDFIFITILDFSFTEINVVILIIAIVW